MCGLLSSCCCSLSWVCKFLANSSYFSLEGWDYVTSRSAHGMSTSSPRCKVITVIGLRKLLQNTDIATFFQLPVVCCWNLLRGATNYNLEKWLSSHSHKEYDPTLVPARKGAKQDLRGRMWVSTVRVVWILTVEGMFNRACWGISYKDLFTVIFWALTATVLKKGISVQMYLKDWNYFVDFISKISSWNIQ